jgi:hypothetical protein
MELGEYFNIAVHAKKLNTAVLNLIFVSVNK